MNVKLNHREMTTNAELLLQHAAWHCLFGSESDQTVREPDQGDKDAAHILLDLRQSIGIPRLDEDVE